jgi:protein involved in polysaccharide export with SLBB domain
MQMNAKMKMLATAFALLTVTFGTSAPAQVKPAYANSDLRVASAGTSDPAASLALTQTYRVGIGDVLDVQLPEIPISTSTLFTVLEGGMLDYPLAGDPLPVAGLTPDEVATLLRKRIKVLEHPRVVISVRDYASHSVAVNGFVVQPGTRFLRREAVPLYVVLAEARPQPGATRAAIARSGHPEQVVDLSQSAATSMLVMPGDVIKVSGVPSGPSEFFFVGGEVTSPGQKPFYAGFTLTQAILASGGLTRAADNNVRLSRQGADGRLSTTEYNLREIQEGKIPDPVLQKGDCLQVGSLP